MSFFLLKKKSRNKTYIYITRVFFFSVVTISDETDTNEFTDDDSNKIRTSQEDLRQRVGQIMNYDCMSNFRLKKIYIIMYSFFFSRGDK